MLYLMVQSGTFTNAVPVIALYAFVDIVFMPALQQIYTSLTTLRFVGPALDAMHKDIKNLKQSSSSKQKHDAMSLKNDITLKNVYYNYPNSSRTALKDVYMNIPTSQHSWDCWCNRQWQNYYGRYNFRITRA